MTQNSVLAIVLAAGKGTRMKSDIPKVMHAIAGAPMLVHVLNAAKGAAVGEICVVVGPGMDEVAGAAKSADPQSQVFTQAEQRGTADAVKAAQGAFVGFAGPVIILYGDTPLLRAETIGQLSRELANGADIVVVGFEADDPTGYGRLLLDERGRLVAIREEKDASEEERAIKLCNSGIMGFRSGKTLTDLLSRIGNANAKGEFYLTDAIALAKADGLDTHMLRGNADEVLGVNSRAELAQAEAAMQQRLRGKVMAEGATLVAPETVFLSHDTRIGKDVLIEPNVIIGPRRRHRGRRDHPWLLPFRRGAYRTEGRGRPLRQAAAWCRPRPEHQGRQFRRDQELRDRRRRQGAPSHLCRRFKRRRARQYRRRHHHLQL